MKILIMSDTHRRTGNIRDLKKQVGEVDMVIHLGDVCGDEEIVKSLFPCEIHMVAGNCDYGADLPMEETFMIGNKKVFITHGHRYSVNYGTERLQQLIKEEGYDIVMYGHTHVRRIERYGGSYIVNPGSLSMPRDGGMPSFLLLDFDKNGTPFFAENELMNMSRKKMLEDLFRY